ncbi:MAG TPA: arginine--tRNA ligase, partial [Verrucomicrobiae bacterium]|nr:arginine--tRNA ligase [Verrucomicrobiae bacterium]
MSIYEQLQKKIVANLTSAATQAKEAGDFNYNELPNFVLEVPNDRSHGDFATNLAMVLTRQAKLSPRIIAEKLIGRFNTAETWVKSIEIAGPGFINFRLD